jgi:glutaconate CoA-transferase subunit B
MDFTPSELMIVNASRALQGSHVVFVGVGLPNIACNLARRSHSPEMELVYESGVFGARPARLPLSIGDPTLVSNATSVTSMADLFMYYLQGGLVDVALLGGAQIDRFGNLNTTVIGDYAHPKVRLPGSGGSMEIAGWANRCYIMTPHQKRRFPEKCDFITSAGFLNGRKQREATGVRGGGTQCVVTDLGLMEPDETGELVLTGLHDCCNADQVKANTGWDIKVSPNLRHTDPPSEEELRILREELDPQGTYR